MAEDRNGSERVIRVAEIDSKHRHTVILQLFKNLGGDDSLQLIVDHDPKRLLYQLEAQYGSACCWAYLEEGPDVWRVRLNHAHRHASAIAKEAAQGVHG